MNDTGGARPWLTHYPEHLRWDASLRAVPFHSLLSRAAERFPNNCFIDFFGRESTFREIDSLADRVAKGLQDRGLKKGDVVAICLPNCPQYVVGLFGALRAGATIANISPLSSAREMIFAVTDSGADYLVTATEPELLQKVDRVSQAVPLKLVITVDAGAALPPMLRFWRRLKSAAPTKTAAPEASIRGGELIRNSGNYVPQECNPAADIALLQYTGGTTGRPKAAMLSHANLTSNIEQGFLWEPGLEEGTMRILGALPFFHIYAFTVVLGLAVRAAAEIVMLPKAEPALIRRALIRKPVTSLPAVPTIYAALIEAGEDIKSALAHIEFSLSGGAPLTADLRQKFERLAGRSIVREGYGLTEASPIVTATPPDAPWRPGSVGLPLPGTEIRITDGTDPTIGLRDGEVGEICVRGPQVMTGYWNQPDHTAEVLRDGWLFTGDVGYLDQDGYLYVIDRKKELILVGGFNVYPRVIEEALAEHPAVAEVAVIAIQDPYYGERPKAFVTCTPGVERPTEAALLEFLAGRLGKYELPAEIDLRDRLPQTRLGKLSKKELVAEERTRYQTRKGRRQPLSRTG